MYCFSSDKVAVGQSYNNGRVTVGQSCSSGRVTVGQGCSNGRVTVGQGIAAYIGATTRAGLQQWQADSRAGLR